MRARTVSSQHAEAGALIIDFSSIRPDVTAAARRAGAGARLPVPRRPRLRWRGGRQERRAVDHGRRRRPTTSQAAKPLFDVVGKTVVHVGPSGSGQTVKAANQLIVAANIQALAEAVVFLEAYGVDTKAALEVLGGGLAGSTVLNQKKENMLVALLPARLPDRPAPQGHGHRHRRRPRGRRRRTARLAGRAAGRVRSRADGDGGLDHSALLRGVERLSGRTATGEEA